MKEIGGYFELELNDGKPFHDTLALNSGRQALLYICKANNYKSILIPNYICNDAFEILTQNGIDVNHYSINENFKPQVSTSKSCDAILYVNYFGLNEKWCEYMLSRFENCIIDNSQAFFSTTGQSKMCFYSARKFFGVPDGAYVYSRCHLSKDIARAPYSNLIFDHLIKRIEEDAQHGYYDFQNQEANIAKSGLNLMSNISDKILRNVDYNRVQKIRLENFTFLHQTLGKFNEIKIEKFENIVPMCYPFLIEKGEELRKLLIANKIYIPFYWEEVLLRKNINDFESKISKNLVAIPVDQRSNINEMTRIKDTILKWLM